MRTRVQLLCLAAATVLSLAPAAFGQSAGSGVTSGPAAGRNVAPSNNAEEKNAPARGATAASQSGVSGQSVGSGAPGVGAKPGTEGGPAQNSPNTNH